MRGTIAMAGVTLFVSCLSMPRSSAAAHLYVSPTVVVWHWDEDPYPDLQFDKKWALVYGARAGYAFTQAFAGELVGLTGTNDASPTGAPSPQESLRLTELDLSLLVHFQSLTSNRL